MSLNLDNPTVDAIKNLRGNPNFDALVNGIGGIAHRALISSLSAPPDNRVDQTAWARALRDLHTALVAVATNSLQRQVEFPASLDVTINTSDKAAATSDQTATKSDPKVKTQ